MTNVFKKKYWSILFVAICISVIASSTTAASSSKAVPNEAVPNADMQLLKSEKHNIDGDEFTIKTFKKDDMIIYTIGDKVKDKRNVAAYADKLLTKSGVSTLSFTTCDNFDKQATDPTSSDAVNRTWGTDCTKITEYTLYTDIKVSSSGYQKATWLGSDPWLPDKIILNQKSTFNGYNVSISVPPSWEKSGDTISWKSAAITGVWYVIATRPSNDATASIPFGNISDADITDSSDIYITKFDITKVYRPQSEIDIY